jgi:hypothetical protein
VTHSERTAPQLTIDGREEEREIVRSHRAGFTPAQREILRLLAERDITSSEAGRIVHVHRSPPCFRCQHGSCAYLAIDGNDALKRLKARGLARRLFAGVWTARR